MSLRGANPKFIAISIPATVSLEAVVTYLTNANLRWEYANPTFEELFQDDRVALGRRADGSCRRGRRPPLRDGRVPARRRRFWDALGPHLG